MLKFTNIILILFFNFNNGKNPQENIIEIARDYIASDFDELIFVSIEKQKLYHIKNNKIINTFIISSSKYGTGSKENSNKTPLGLHKIEEKHGENTPTNGKMIGRVFYGEIAKIFNDKTQSKTDDITSRILWLSGLEKGKNKGNQIDSYKRYIYIHGTSEEGRLGSPASHGCIRMKNKDVIDLYKTVEVGTLVLIL
ncbi:MAG: hypothetical protein CMD14_01260 [Flavobacteriales bacterium]|nr:hypothetical protein [Flavobacteriales bacterium]|tara:strand:+ start:15002 stop:15589 length:588 start_codon:yes stop_codon:yes gene_type:complete